MAIILNGTTGIAAPGTETFGDGTALGGATNPIVSMAKGANNYVQGYIVNNTDAANSSADLVCYPSNGTDSSGWIDMGITGPTFSQAAYGITGQNEGYIFMSAPSGASKTGNLVLATDSTGTQNAIKFATGGFGSTTERMRLDASGNLLVGATSTFNSNKFYVNTNSGANAAFFSNNVDATFQLSLASGLTKLDAPTGTLTLATNGAERARIDSSGNLLVGTTGAVYSGKIGVSFNGNGGAGAQGIALIDINASLSGDYALFVNSSGNVAGRITHNGTTTVAYTTSSDYRLKENIAPMTGALAKVAALKPVTYTWKDDQSESEGFIAHELAEVCPQAVVGEKDAMDEQENPKYQGIDTSFLVATLTAAIQEQQAIIESLTTRITALEKA